MTEAAFKRHERVLKKKEFDRVFENSRTIHGKTMVVKAARNNMEFSRLGLIVKRTGTAVERNRKKRLMREAFRLSKNNLPTGWDFVAIARKKVEMNLEQAMEDFEKTARKVKKCAG